MHRIIIFGNSGSGKSTLAKQLVAESGLVHLDLDILAWLPETPPQRAPLDESRIKIDSFVQSNTAWVIEGCYADLLELAASSANEAIFMDLSVEQCIDNARNRPWEPHKYASKQAQDQNLAMLIDWIREYTERTDEFSYVAHKRLYDSFTGKKECIHELVN